MSTTTWPDVEGALRAWLRERPEIQAVVDRRVFFGVPDGARFPLITVSRVGGGEDFSPDVPLDLATIELQVWGNPRRKGETTAIVNALRGVLHDVRGRVPLNADVDAFGAAVAGVAYSPDPATDQPRYIVTAQVTAMSAA